jgi:hypothetical protein
MYKFELTGQQLNVLMRALQAMPLGEAFDCFMAIQNQLAQQQQQQLQPALQTPQPQPVPNGKG